MRVESPTLRRIARTAVLFGGLAVPAGLGAVACSEGYNPTAKITSSNEGEVKSEQTHDPDKYTYKTVILVQPYHLGNQSVGLYTQTEPKIDISSGSPQVTLEGTVYCPEDSQGPAVGCSDNKDKFLNGARFTLEQGGINIIKRYDPKTSTKGMSTNSDAYMYKVSVQVETGGQQDRVNIYSFFEPKVGNVGSIPVITIDNAFCDTEREHANQIGCSGLVESVTLIGGWGTTTITKQK